MSRGHHPNPAGQQPTNPYRAHECQFQLPTWISSNQRDEGTEPAVHHPYQHHHRHSPLAAPYSPCQQHCSHHDAYRSPLDSPLGSPPPPVYRDEHQQHHAFVPHHQHTHGKRAPCPKHGAKQREGKKHSAHQHQTFAPQLHQEQHDHDTQDAVEVFDPEFKFVKEVPSSLVVHLPPARLNITRLVFCRNYKCGEARSCSMGEGCKFVHADVDVDSLEAHPIHVKYSWRHEDLCTYARLPPGEVLSLFPPSNRPPLEHFPSQRILVTRGSIRWFNTVKESPKASGEGSLPTHCLHYYFNRMCNRGNRCSFIHVVHVDPTVTGDFRRAPGGKWGSQGSPHAQYPSSPQRSEKVEINRHEAVSPNKKLNSSNSSLHSTPTLPKAAQPFSSSDEKALINGAVVPLLLERIRHNASPCSQSQREVQLISPPVSVRGKERSMTRLPTFGEEPAAGELPSTSETRDRERPGEKSTSEVSWFRFDPYSSKKRRVGTANTDRREEMVSVSMGELSVSSVKVAVLPPRE